MLILKKRMMNLFTKLISLMLSVCILGFSPQVFSYHEASGQNIPNSVFANKWVIINYWADWCDSCLEEIPELNNFYKNNQDSNIMIIGVNYDGLPAPALRQSIARTGIQFPVLLEDPGKRWKLGEITALPTTFVVSPNGDVVRKIIGPNTEQSLLKVIQNRVYGKSSIKRKMSDIA